MEKPYKLHTRGTLRTYRIGYLGNFVGGVCCYFKFESNELRNFFIVDLSVIYGPLKIMDTNSKYQLID